MLTFGLPLILHCDSVCGIHTTGSTVVCRQSNDGVNLWRAPHYGVAAKSIDVSDNGFIVVVANDDTVHYKHIVHDKWSQVPGSGRVSRISVNSDASRGE